MALAHAEQLGVFGAVRGGAIVLLALALVGAMAPFLGTFDPSAMDASFISVAAGTAGNVTLPDGSPLQHTFWMGSDSVGRDIWSRVLYGTRISLLVGLLTAALAVVIGCRWACWQATDTMSSRTMRASCARQRIRGTNSTAASALGSTTCASSATAGR